MKNQRAWIELDEKALQQNVHTLQRRLPRHCMLMPVLKANGYGHGAVLLGKKLQQMGIQAFAVACLSEGIALRKAGIKGMILVLGYTQPQEARQLQRYRLTQTVVDAAYAEQLNQYGKKISVHIGIDTGMHRLGERSENIERIAQIYQMKHLKVEGMMTHLCTDDSLNLKEQQYTRKQAEAFYQVVNELEQKGYPRPKLHLQSSYSVLLYPELAEDYARVGIALYGVLSTKEDTKRWGKHLQPVLSLKARVASVRRLYQGEGAGYGLQFTAERDMKIAALTIGYADGLPRNLSGRGYVLLAGKKAPILGRICMDQTLVDVTALDQVQAGDIATVIGRDGDEIISVCDLAEQSETIANDIFTGLGSRLERIFAEPN